MGNPGEFTIRELAEKVISLTGSSSELSFVDLPQDDPRQRQPNIDQAHQRYGWKPAIQLEEGLKKTIDYFDNFLQR